MTAGKETEKPNAQSQLDKFKEAARELETNEDEAAFDRVLKKVARSKTAADDGKQDKGTKDKSR